MPGTKKKRTLPRMLFCNLCNKSSVASRTHLAFSAILLLILWFSGRDFSSLWWWLPNDMQQAWGISSIGSSRNEIIKEWEHQYLNRRSGMVGWISCAQNHPVCASQARSKYYNNDEKNGEWNLRVKKMHVYIVVAAAAAKDEWHIRRRT